MPVLRYSAPTRAAAPGWSVPGTLGGSQPQDSQCWGHWEGHSPRPRTGGLPGGPWAGCLAAGKKWRGPGRGSWGLPASPQETLAAFSAVLHDDVWAVSLDVNAGAACAPIQTEERLSLFFLIRDNNASEKSSTGWLWLAQKHWVVKQDTGYNPHFCSFHLQSVSFRVRHWSHTVLQSAGPASLGS